MSEGWNAQVNRDREFWQRAGEWIQQATKNAKPSDAPITEEELEEGWQAFKAQYPGLFVPIERVQSDCKTCYGYGMWDDDSGQPMGPLDGIDGLPTRACPECGANQNPRLNHIAPDGVTPVVPDEDRTAE